MKTNKMVNRVLPLLLVFVLVIAFTACGSKKSETASYDMATSEETTTETSAEYAGAPEMAYEDNKAGVETEEAAQEAPAYDADGGSTSGTNGDITQSVLTGRKVIQNKYVSMETLKFDETVKNIEAMVEQGGGYIEGSQVYGVAMNQDARYNPRYGSFTLRVPADSFGAFYSALKELGNVLQESNDVADVTNQYFDLQARINSLEVQEKRLIELVASGKQLEDILAIETQLAQVRYEIEVNTATIRNLDNQVNFATVRLDLKEVFEETVIEPVPVTVWERISSGFKNSMENVKEFFIDFFVGFVVALPYLVLWAIFIVVLILVLRAINKHHRKNKKTATPPKSAFDALSQEPVQKQDEPKDK